MPPVANALFAASDLTTPLGRVATADETAHAERIVWGWLSGPVGLTARPNPTPDNLWAWAVELGAIYLVNPTGLSSRQLGSSQQAFSAERRSEILDDASSGSATSALRPRGSFPDARCYPDPVE